MSGGLRGEDLAGAVLEADLTWTGRRFESEVRVEVGSDGRIAEVYRPGDELPASAPKPRRLRHRALLPGFVNVHSHAFQRGLRGRGETYPAGAGSFWTWREEMYALVAHLDHERLHRLCVQAFREMRSAGITTAGEFHYLHHDDPEALDFAFDDVVLAAAAEAGIRLVLLSTYYAAGGVGSQLTPFQRRFATPGQELYWERMDRLAERLDRDTERPLQSLGVAAHSIRAVSMEDIEALYQGARGRDLPFHMHVEEQRREVEESLAGYGEPPMAVLLNRLELSNLFTAVHCTHTRPGDLARFVAVGGNVCVCPLTEGNLGDGLPALATGEDPGETGPATYRLCLGTDSNARISMLEEMRWLEYGQRLRRESRGILREEEGSVARTLLETATVSGARALNLDAGEVEPGSWADFTAIDLTQPSLDGFEPDNLLDALAFGSGNEAIAATCVGGFWEDHR